jgi:hypothetical protein
VILCHARIFCFGRNESKHSSAYTNTKLYGHFLSSNHDLQVSGLNSDIKIFRAKHHVQREITGAIAICKPWHCATTSTNSARPLQAKRRASESVNEQPYGHDEAKWVSIEHRRAVPCVKSREARFRGRRCACMHATFALHLDSARLAPIATRHHLAAAATV